MDEVRVIAAGIRDARASATTTPADGGGRAVEGEFLGATLSNDSVNANTAAGNGGGIFSSRGLVTLDSDTTVNRNHAAAGGGIYDPLGRVTVDGATVRDNTPDNCQPAPASARRRDLRHRRPHGRGRAACRPPTGAFSGGPVGCDEPMALR